MGKDVWVEAGKSLKKLTDAKKDKEIVKAIKKLAEQAEVLDPRGDKAHMEQLAKIYSVLAAKSENIGKSGDAAKYNQRAAEYKPQDIQKSASKGKPINHSSGSASDSPNGYSSSPSSDTENKIKLPTAGSGNELVKGKFVAQVEKEQSLKQVTTPANDDAAAARKAAARARLQKGVGELTALTAEREQHAANAKRHGEEADRKFALGMKVLGEELEHAKKLKEKDYKKAGIGGLV